MKNKKGRIKSQAKARTRNSENIINISKTKLNQNKGITLIALVVTIIVLIILAVISINMIFGNSGLFDTARSTRQYQANATTDEKGRLGKLENAIKQEGGTNGSSGGGTNLPDITPTTPVGTEVKAPSKWTSTKVTAISDGSGNAIPLPDGFYYVGGNRTEGLVISDNSNDKNKGTSYATASTLQGNQFVWIPVDNEEAITRTEFDSSTGQPAEGLDTEYKEPNTIGYGYSYGKETQEITDFNTMKTQVLKYNGFYIGRYEAGDATAGTTLRATVTTDHEVVCKKGVAPYNYIPWGKSTSDINTAFAPSVNNTDKVTTHGMVYLAKNMYIGKEQAQSITSTLCYSSQWDAMCRYIGDANRKTDTKSAEELTGSVETDMSKNIYDLAGNCQEWTFEANGYSSGNRVYRGRQFLPF